MPQTHKVLGQSNPAATTLTTLYTVPSSTSVIASTLAICNQSSSAGTFRVAVRPAGASVAASHYIAFDAPTLDDLHRHRDRWRRHGHTVAEVDHEFCRSIYLTDPSGNMVEFCHTVRAFTDDERERALDVVTNRSPDLDDETARITIWPPIVDDALDVSTT